MLRRIFDLLFGGLSSKSSETNDTDDYEKRQRQVEKEYQDVIKGWQFVATLNLDTPLETLERHGEVFEGHFDDRPDYGDLSQGIWSPKTKSSAELGIDAPEFPQTTTASEVGQVPTDGGEFLAFLKDFRRIVESDDTISDKIEQINELLEKKPEYQKFAAKLGDEFPEGWFASQLTEVEGIGEATAKRLFGSGFRSVEELCGASDDELRAVHGVGAVTVDSIRAHCSEARG